MVYRCFSEGVRNRKLFSQEEFFDKAITLINQNPNKDFYESIYVYDKSHFEAFKQTKSLAGIRGLKTDRIVFDFDSKEVVQLAINDANILVQRLLDFDIPEEAIRIFFSGNKGTHVEVHLNSFITRPQFENIVDELAGDLRTFDTRIKDDQRLFRFPLTVHQTTHFYKIPLTVTELKKYSLDEIIKIAKEPDIQACEDFMATWKSIDIPEIFVQAAKPKVKEKKTLEMVDLGDVNPANQPDLSRIPKHLTPAKYVLQEGFFEEGERNEACMILASTYRYLGYNQELAYNMLKATLRMRSQRLGHPEYDKEELWKTIIEPVYSPTWQGGTYNEEAGLLKKVVDRFNLQKLKTVDAGLVSLGDVSSFYKDFAVNIDKNTIKLGIPELDKKVRVTTSMFVCFLAAPGAGKTTVGFNLLNSISNNGEKSIFFSLDMAIPQVYQRLIQKHTGDKESEIEYNYKHNKVERIEEYQAALSEEYKNVKFCFRSGMTTEHIKSAILSERDRSGIMPKLVLIDYLECIQGPFSDSNANKALIATQLKDIANELQICVFLLVQPAKVSGDPSEELRSYTQIKGASVLGEAATVVFTLHRPGFSPDNPEDDRFATIKVVKNRMGTLSSTDLGWEGLTGRIFALDAQGKAELEALKKAIADEKAAEKTSGGDFY